MFSKTISKKTLIVIFILIFSGCSAKMDITSNPSDAMVVAKVVGEEKEIILGKTPLEVVLDGTHSNLQNNGPFMIHVRKKGHFTENVVVPNLFSEDFKLDISLKPNLVSNYRNINLIIEKVFKAERLILEQNYVDAEKLVLEIRNLNDNISIAYHLQGTIFYLKGDYKKSLDSWIRAAELNPNDADAVEMISRIEKEMDASVQ